MKYFILYILVVFLAYSCTDVIIPDIGNDMVEHITPVNQAVLRSGDVDFEWERIDFVDSVRFTLVSPSFIDRVFICLDTFLTGNRLNMQLPTDEYEWKTVGYNEAFETRSVVSGFEVITDQTLWLGEDAIVLSSPEDGFITNADSVQFMFESLDGVESYEIIIADSSGSVVKTTMVENLRVTCAIANEGAYTWHVLGHNSKTNTTTKMGDSRNFTIDREGPPAPRITQPMMDTIQIKTMGPHISWDAMGGVSSSITLQLQTGMRDTLFSRMTGDEMMTLPSNLIDIFTSNSVKLDLSLYTTDDLGNVSDTTKVEVVVGK